MGGLFGKSRWEKYFLPFHHFLSFLFFFSHFWFRDLGSITFKISFCHPMFSLLPLLPVLEIEPSASHMLSIHSTTKLHSSSLSLLCHHPCCNPVMLYLLHVPTTYQARTGHFIYPYFRCMLDASQFLEFHTPAFSGWFLDPTCTRPWVWSPALIF
jgi:hypothetical protein